MSARISRRVIQHHAERAARARGGPPLLFEAGLESNYDATIAVVADEAVRAERAGARP